MSPLLKYQRETEKKSSAIRSRFRQVKGRRRLPSPIRKTAQNPSQTQVLLITVPPKAPEYPRAIFHATCAPVHASRTKPFASSTRPEAISPALPHQTFTSQASDFLS